MIKTPQIVRAFTLIELLVVISIIGIISSLVVIRLTGKRRDANFAQVKTSIHNTGNSIELYKEEYGGVISAGTSGYATISFQGAPPENSTLFQRIFNGKKINATANSSYDAYIKKTPGDSYTFLYGTANASIDGSGQVTYGTTIQQSPDSNCYQLYAQYFDPSTFQVTNLITIINGTVQPYNSSDCRL
jgi:prepilin-type N-terminal cleavage/methylation domain-containing protein